MRDRSRRLRLLAFPRGRSRAADGSARSSEARGSWKLVVRGARGRGRVSLEASLATLAHPFRPCTVRLNGHALRRGRAWTYDRRTRVLKVSFTARAGATVVARRACTAPR
jgi:hypothetical protein